MTDDEKRAWDQYAALAAAGILASANGSSLHSNPALPGSQEFIARDAAAIADRLLAKRRERRI